MSYTYAPFTPMEQQEYNILLSYPRLFLKNHIIQQLDQIDTSTNIHKFNIYDDCLRTLKKENIVLQNNSMHRRDVSRQQLQIVLNNMPKKSLCQLMIREKWLFAKSPLFLPSFYKQNHFPLLDNIIMQAVNDNKGKDNKPFIKKHRPPDASVSQALDMLIQSYSSDDEGETKNQQKEKNCTHHDKKVLLKEEDINNTRKLSPHKANNSQKRCHQKKKGHKESKKDIKNFKVSPKKLKQYKLGEKSYNNDEKGQKKKKKQNLKKCKINKGENVELTLECKKGLICEDTKEDSTCEDTKEDSTCKNTKENSTCEDTKEDSTCKNTKEDSTCKNTKEDSTCENTKEDSTCENTKEDSTCENTKEDSTCENTKEDSTCENTKEDSTCKNTKEDSTCENTKEDSTCENTKEDSTCENTKKDLTCENTKEDSTCKDEYRTAIPFINSAIYTPSSTFNPKDFTNTNYFSLLDSDSDSDSDVDTCSLQNSSSLSSTSISFDPILNSSDEKSQYSNNFKELPNFDNNNNNNNHDNDFENDFENDKDKFIVINPDGTFPSFDVPDTSATTPTTPTTPDTSTTTTPTTPKESCFIM